MVLNMSAIDPEINRRMSLVTTMLAHPNSLAQPRTLLRTARLQLASGLRRKTAAEAR
jgi:hypothetical protein